MFKKNNDLNNKKEEQGAHTKNRTKRGQASSFFSIFSLFFSLSFLFVSFLVTTSFVFSKLWLAIVKLSSPTSDLIREYELDHLAPVASKILAILAIRKGMRNEKTKRTRDFPFLNSRYLFGRLWRFSSCLILFLSFLLSCFFRRESNRVVTKSCLSRLEEKEKPRQKTIV